MGMFDKDKEIGLVLTRAFARGEHFILLSTSITREDFPTKYGPSPQATLRVRNMQTRQEFEVTTLASAIVSKVREADPEDFPAIVFWTEAPTTRTQDGTATVLQYVGPLGGPRAVADHDADPGRESGDPGPGAS